MIKAVKRLLILLLAFILCAGCSANKAPKKPQEPKAGFKIITTIFPLYDFTKNIAGDLAEITMLLPPGAESHSFEPTPQDLIRIQNCSLFIYIGGESDAWVERLKSSIAPQIVNELALIKNVSAVVEEYKEGMEEDEHDHTPEYDEHIWTSPKISMRMVLAIRDALIKTDPEHETVYRKNAEGYLEQLIQLDKSFIDITKVSLRKTLLFGSRFPFRYFADEYGLDYYAAFPGCASNTEPSAATIAFLTDRVKAEKIPVVFHTEFANEQIADIICEATGAKKLLLHSCHNVSQREFESGASYISLMQLNAQALKEALN